MSKIKTTGQLREFLANSLLAVSSGQMDTDRARNITKLAAQINESIYSEIKTARVLSELGREPAKLGNLTLGTDNNDA
jgi:hypothetical protein